MADLLRRARVVETFLAGQLRLLRYFGLEPAECEWHITYLTVLHGSILRLEAGEQLPDVVAEKFRTVVEAMEAYQVMTPYRRF